MLNFHQRPVPGRNRRDIRDYILSKQVQIKSEQIPSGWTMEAADFINRVKTLIKVEIEMVLCLLFLADSKESDQ